MLLVAEGRAHDAACRMVPILVEIFALIQRQVLDQRLAIDPHALLAGAADGFMGLLAGGVDDIERNARHIRQHDSAVGCFAFHFRGS